MSTELEAGQDAADASYVNISAAPSGSGVSLKGEATKSDGASSQQNGNVNVENGEESAGKPLSPPPESSIEPTPSPQTRNVVIFGESGSGKSSVINAIAQQEISATSGDAAGCTFRSQPHRVEFSGYSYMLFDTVGLNEAAEGTVPAAVAEDNLKSLLRGLAKSGSGGIGLLVYCVRGPRVHRALTRNYNIFYSAICRKKVPIVIVVTGLENQKPTMESWWMNNEKELQKYDMHFKDHACVTTLRKEPDVPDVFTQRISDSSDKLRNLIINNYAEWMVDNSLITLALAGMRNLISGRRSEIPSPPVLIICDPSHREVEIAECINGTMQTCVAHIDEVAYQVHRVPEPQESDAGQISSAEGRLEADLLIYYARMDDKEVHKKFKTFCTVYRGNVVPVIVVVKGSNNQESASQWIKLNIVEHGAGTLVPAFTPARDPNDSSAGEMTGQELRKLIHRSHLIRYGGRGTRGIFKSLKFWGK